MRTREQITSKLGGATRSDVPALREAVEALLEVALDVRDLLINQGAKAVDQ